MAGYVLFRALPTVTAGRSSVINRVHVEEEPVYYLSVPGCLYSLLISASLRPQDLISISLGLDTAAGALLFTQTMILI